MGRSPCFSSSFDLPIQTLDGIRRVDERPDLRGILEKGRYLVPVRSPGGGDMRIALVPFFRELFEGCGSLLFRGRLADRPQVLGHRLPLFPRYITKGVSDLMDNAFLDPRSGEDGLDRFGYPLEVVHGEDQNVLDSAVLELVKNGQPVLGRFGLADPEAQAFLLPIEVDPDDRVYRNVPDMAFMPHLQEHSIHIDQGIDGFQRPVLPFPGPVQDLVRDRAHRLRRDLVTVEIIDVGLDVPSRHPLGVHGDDLVLEPGYVLLALLYDLELKIGLPLPGNLQADLAIF